MTTGKLCLGIESTAHTFGASVMTFAGEVLSNERKLFTTEQGGLVPAELSDHHTDICDAIIEQAVQKAGVSFSDVSLISFSQSPGIGHALRIGASCARSLALLLDIPLIGVNHCIAHLEIGRLKGKPYVATPAPENGQSLASGATASCLDPVLLYASGANTQVIAYEGKKYRVFGETLDIGVGNFLDTIARELGLGFPGGPKIQALAAQGKNFIPLPYNVKGMDVNFAGIQTKLKQLIKDGKHSTEDLCFSIQETVFAMLLEVSERALAHTEKKELLLGGGVACNTRLQEMAHVMCQERGATCFVLPNEFNIDNAAMIAWQGIIQFNSGQRTAIQSSQIDPYLRTDDVDVTWRE
jgi:glycoprotease/Kae1 family metallohydrolase